METEQEPREENEEQALFLLERLQELKAWQREQEEKLLQEQEQQINDLLEQREALARQSSNDDDTTLSQDISEIFEYEDDYDEEFEEEGDEVSRGYLENDPLIPSWANKSSDSTAQFDARFGEVSIGHNNASGRDTGDAEERESRPVENIDDKPIVAPKKTFEELLAEQLGSDIEPQPKEEQQSPAFVKSSPSKTFLRKGSGLQRYGGRNVKLRRTQSQCSAGSNGAASKMKSSVSCPKMNVADKETISSISKRSPPKRIISEKVLSSKSSSSSSSRRTSGSTAREKPVNKAISKLQLKPKTPKSAVTVQRTRQDRLVPSTNKPLNKTLLDEDAMGIYDSVELSFREKLVQRDKSHKKELEELEAFELLEEAAEDSSFCSQSSTVKRLMPNLSTKSMPSPIAKGSATSTPMIKKNTRRDPDSDPDPSLGMSLLDDIQNFLQRKGAVVQEQREDDSDHDDSTIVEEDGVLDEDDHLEIQNYDDQDSDTSWCDVENEDGEENKENERNHVRFKDDAMSFSPPKVSKNSPSYLIWSIFTKEREERAKQKREYSKVTGNGRKVRSAPNGQFDSPLSNAPMKTSDDFNSAMFSAKIAELNKEIDRFKRENSALIQGKRRLQTDRKKLLAEVEEFEKTREVERKRMEEEKRRVRRDKLLLDKSQKERENKDERKQLEEIDELQAKVLRLQEDLHRKESKWSAALTKLQDQVKFLEKENQQLHEENHKLKLKTVGKKVSTHLVNPSKKPVEVIPLKPDGRPKENETPDSGFRDDERLKRSADSIQSRIYRTLCAGDGNGEHREDLAATPSMTFSPADSLESSVTLVSGSGSVANSPPKVEVKSVVRNPTKGTTEKVYSDGSVEICYANGNRKEISPDGKNVKVLYYNGDVKETLGNGLVKYFYSQTKTWHLTYPDKKEVLQFNNGQEEIRYPNGELQITFADGSVKKIATDGSEDIRFPDGTRVEVKANGDRTLLMPNGQREVHTSQFKRREYPDGTAKILFNDGRQETRYSNGRVRIKDKNGTLIHDSQQQGVEVQ